LINHSLIFIEWIPIIFVTYFIVSTIVEIWLAVVAAQYASKSPDEETKAKTENQK